jgi:hypothetical protein
MSDDRRGSWRGRLRPAFLLALVAAGATAATVVARTTRSPSVPTAVATSPDAHVSVPAPSTAGPTVTTGTLPVAPGPPSTPATTVAPPKHPAAGGVRAWPAGRSGYTVVLGSLPESAGRPAAVAQARAALRAGIANVGVLLSSRYSSLRAGYWVVYAGELYSSGAAQAAAAAGRARGYPEAYPARVAP